MDHTHISDEERDDALEGYRWALGDAVRELGSEASRDDVVARAREMLGEDEPDQLAVITELANGDGGDPVWNLEEEVIDDQETVPSGETSSDG